IVVERPESLLVLGDRPVELGDSVGPTVLVVAGTDRVDRRALDELGAVEVGEALAEVDGLVSDREAGHLGEDRGAEALQTRREPRQSGAGHPGQYTQTRSRPRGAGPRRRLRRLANPGVPTGESGHVHRDA